MAESVLNELFIACTIIGIGFLVGARFASAAPDTISDPENTSVLTTIAVVFLVIGVVGLLRFFRMSL